MRVAFKMKMARMHVTIVNGNHLWMFHSFRGEYDNMRTTMPFDYMRRHQKVVSSWKIFHRVHGSMVKDDRAIDASVLIHIIDFFCGSECAMRYF